MTTVKQYNKYGEELEKLLLLRTAPLAIKLLEKEADIPEGAVRPKRDRGHHIAQCQAFALSRRKRETIAMLTEDHWCWAPLMGYGLVENPHDAFVDAHTSFPCLPHGKYIGLVSAPLSTATFEPDLVLVYSNTAQLRHMLISVKFQGEPNIPSEFDPIDSCVYSVVPVIENGQFRITLPDPGEFDRAAAGDDEIIFSIPRDKIGMVVEGLKKAGEMNMDYAHAAVGMQPDFPRPDFYVELFKKWGLDVEEGK